MALPRELEVECLLCKEIVKCQENDTSILVDHVKLKHPDIKISNLPKELNAFPKSADKPIIKDKIVSSPTSSSEKTKIVRSILKDLMEDNNLLSACDGNSTPGNTLKNGNSPKIAKSTKSSKPLAKKRKFYKTSVEKWKPGSDKIFCPKCDRVVRPLIRTSADRVSHSSIGAALIMTCWPFCFFPFLFPAPVKENLHCKLCGYYFGTYDYQKQTMNVSKKPVPQKAKSMETVNKQTNDSKHPVPQKAESIDTMNKAEKSDVAKN